MDNKVVTESFLIQVPSEGLVRDVGRSIRRIMAVSQKSESLTK